MPNKGWVLLKTFNNEHEAAIIESLLAGEEIKVLKKYRDIGDYLKIYMGMSNLGIDILVPQHSYAQAIEIINSATGITDTDEFISEYQGTEVENGQEREQEDDARQESLLAAFALFVKKLFNLKEK